jgi:hypothetical protein
MIADLRYWTARMLSSIAASVDGQESSNKPRASQYDEPYVINALAKKYPSVDGGEYRVASMGPGATALQLGISAAFNAAQAAIAFSNQSKAATPNKRCYLDYIRFLVSIAPTSATELLAATVIDSKDRTPTTIANGSGGTGPGAAATATAYRSPVIDPNMDNGAPSIIGVPYFPLSAAAGVPPAVPVAGPDARTIVGNLPLRAQIPVVSDEYIIDFGSSDAPASGALVTAAPAGASRVVVSHPGVVLGPLQWFLLHLWGPGNITAGLAFKGVDMGWWER